MKIFFLDHCDCVGGAQISLRNLVGHLAENRPGILASRPPGDSFFPRPIRGTPFRMLSLCMNAVYYAWIFRRLGRPVWYCNSVWDRLQSVLVPPDFVVTHIRDIPRRWHRVALKVLPSNRYIVSSAFMERELSGTLPGASPVSIVPNIVAAPAVGPNSRRPPLKPFRLLMVANLCRWKNHALAIEARSRLSAGGVGATLDIWGSDPLGENREYADWLRMEISRHGGAVRLIENRRIGPEDYSEYHCLIHPADREPFGRVIVEGMQNGLPVLVPDSGNGQDLVHKYGGGLIYRHGNPEEAGKGLAEIYSRYGYYKDEVISCFSRLERDFSSVRAQEALDKALGGIQLTRRAERPFKPVRPRAN